jgi:hypothetical protein
VAEIMRDECATALTPASDTFWVLAAALRGFVEAEGGGDLPLEVRVTLFGSFTAGLGQRQGGGDHLQGLCRSL